MDTYARLEVWVMYVARDTLGKMLHFGEKDRARKHENGQKNTDFPWQRMPILGVGNRRSANQMVLVTF